MGNNHEEQKHISRASVAKAVLEKHGKSFQIKMMIEEMAELTVALCHVNRGRVPESSIAEEIADCLAMTDQMDLIFKNTNHKTSQNKTLDNELDQILTTMGRLQNWLLLAENHISGDFIVKKLLREFRQELNVYSEFVGTEKVNNWRKIKHERMIRRLGL